METHSTEQIIARIQSEEGQGIMNGWDSRWSEVMKLAEGYGFIVQAFGGVATLATNEEQIKQMGLEHKAAMLRASGLVGQVMNDEQQGA